MPRPHPIRAFTLIEVLITVLILSISALLAQDMIGNTEATMRAERAAREALAALRYARTLAITTGGTYGVEFDTTNKLFQVYNKPTVGANTIVSQNLVAGGTYVINLTNPELNGTTMTVSITGDTTNPYDLAYTGLGSTANPGTINFSFGGYSRVLTVPAVGDPTLP